MTKDQIKDGDYCTYNGIKCTFSKTSTGFDLQPIDPSQNIGHGIGIRHSIVEKDWDKITDLAKRTA